MELALDPHMTRLEAVRDPDEPVLARVRAEDASLEVTARRMVVAAYDRVKLNIPLSGLRRIELNIEQDRATLIVVPESPHDMPQVLYVPLEEFDPAGLALQIVGRHLMERGKAGRSQP